MSATAVITNTAVDFPHTLFLTSSKRPPILSLPPELTSQILTHISCQPSFVNALLSCSSIHNVFLPQRQRLRTAALTEEIHPALLVHALALDEVLGSNNRSAKELQGFCERFRAKRARYEGRSHLAKDDFSIALNHEETRARLKRTHSLVSRFALHFLSVETSRLTSDLRPRANDPENPTPPPPPSASEIIRAQRAFYNFYLHSLIFREPFSRGHAGSVPVTPPFDLAGRHGMPGEDGGTGEGFDAARDCHVVEGWEWREMMGVVGWVRREVRNWAGWFVGFAERGLEGEKWEGRHYCKNGVLSPHWLSYIETSGLPLLSNLLLPGTTLPDVISTFSQLTHYDNLTFQALSAAAAERTWGGRARRVCLPEAGVGKEEYEEVVRGYDGEGFKREVVVEAGLFDDWRCEEWGLVLPL